MRTSETAVIAESLPPETDDVDIRMDARPPEPVRWLGDGAFETRATNHEFR